MFGLRKTEIKQELYASTFLEPLNSIKSYSRLQELFFLLYDIFTLSLLGIFIYIKYPLNVRLGLGSFPN